MKRVAWAVPLVLASCALHFPDRELHHGRLEVAAGTATTPLVDEPATEPVVLFADELHTGLIFELAWLEEHGYRVPPGLQRRRHVVFSWGDETAYVQKRWLNPAQVVHALFLPSTSVMEVISFDYHVPEVCPTQRLYQGFIRDSAGRAVADFLNSCTRMDGDGRPEVVADSTWGDGLMVRSPHAYYFPRICNVWTVDALNAAGFRFHGLTGLSADGIIRQAERPENGFRKIWDPAWIMPEGPPPPRG